MISLISVFLVVAVASDPTSNGSAPSADDAAVMETIRRADEAAQTARAAADGLDAAIAKHESQQNQQSVLLDIAHDLRRQADAQRNFITDYKEREDARKAALAKSNDEQNALVEQAQEEADSDDDDGFLGAVTHPFRAAYHLVKDTLVAMKAGAGKVLDVPKAVVTGDFDKLKRMDPVNIATLNLIPAAQRVASTVVSDGLSVLPVQKLLAPMLEDEPDNISPDKCPCYYVNGVDVSRTDAEKAAAAIGPRIGRKVYLIYNDTHGREIDVAAALVNRLLPIAGNTFDPTVRQLTWVLNHCHTRVTIITHSGGGIEMRCALIAAAALGNGDKITHRVSWIELAPPIRDEEVVIKPSRFLSVLNPDDLIRFTGIRTEIGGGKGDGHDLEEYLGIFDLPQVKDLIYPN